MNNIINQFKEWYKSPPIRKRHIEFISALLSVPVMLTVIILNLNNLNSSNKKQPITPQATPIQVIIKNEEDKQKTSDKVTPSPNTSPSQDGVTPPLSCIKEVGGVSIVSPMESEVVEKNPVCITISTQSGYCPIEWSYRINNGNWSDYTDKDICLRNLDNGNKTLQMRIKSTTSKDQITLQRSFVYQGNLMEMLEPTIATSSAN